MGEEYHYSSKSIKMLQQILNERDEEIEQLRQREKSLLAREALANGRANEQRQRAEIAEAALAAERDSRIQQLNQLEQTLAQALGSFPWYKDDQQNFPGATAESGVCVGELVIEDLVAIVAERLAAERARRCDSCYWRTADVIDGGWEYNCGNLSVPHAAGHEYHGCMCWRSRCAAEPPQ